MPRLNSNGEYAMGVGGHQGSINGVLVPDAYGPYWMNDDDVVFGQTSNGLVQIMNVDTSIREQAEPNGIHNNLRAGGNNWAAFIANPPILFSPNFNLPDAGLLDVGPDGAIGFRTLYHSNFGVEIFELTGERWTLNTTDVVHDLQLLGNKRAIWKNLSDNKIMTFGIPPCIQVGNAYRPRATFINGEWWVCYWSDSVGLILHPFNSTVGYIVVPLEIDAFGHDAIAFDTIEKIAWSTTAGELPEHYRDKFIDTAVDQRQELVPQIQVPAIGKPCWLCWFEFVDELAYIPPGNSYMWVKQGGGITRTNGELFAQWVEGNTVEEIERQDNGSFPIVAYWDSRVWPRLPNISPKSWTAIQAYCKVTETPQQFEMNLSNYINTLPMDRKYCLVCQCYSDNNSLTKDLIGIVPVFARLARDYNQISFLMPFNDQGRGNAEVGGGLQWNPQVKPYWEQLYAGIIGEPVANPQLPPKICEALKRERNKYGVTPTGPELAQILNDTAWQFPPDWGLSRKNSGFYVNSPERPGLGNIASDILHRKSDNLIWDVLIAAGEHSEVNCSEALGEMTDPNRPWVEPVQPPNEPVIGRVDIIYHDPVCRRSDPAGCLIRFDIQSPNPVVEAEFDLDGDGEPSLAVFFSGEIARDGRYVRGLAFKFTVNGIWVLRVTAKDDQGNIYRSDGTHLVEVTF